MYRNDPHGPYKAHLYPDDAVNANGGPPNTDERVTSLCKGAETYGPLRPIHDPPDDGDDVEDHICGTCVAVWRARRGETETETDTDTEDN